MELTVRPLCAEDAAAVLALSRILGGETRNLTFGPEGIPQTEAAERAYLAAQEHSPDMRIFGAFDGGALVGTAHVTRVSARPRMAHRAGVAVSVRKSHWNQGVATRLLEACLAAGRALGCTVFELEVLAGNAAAIHLYEKLGFRTVGRYPQFFHYEDGSAADALLMNLYC